MILKRLSALTLIGFSVVLGSVSSTATIPEAAAASDVRVGYDGIPRNAMRVSSGKGVLRLRVARSGTVWIGDDTFERQLLAKRVKRLDVVEVDPYTNEVSINGRVVYNTRTLIMGHRHSIFHLDGRERPKWN